MIEHLHCCVPAALARAESAGGGRSRGEVWGHADRSREAKKKRYLRK